MTNFFAVIERLDRIDWKVIASWSWRNRDDDLDRKRRKQAEFLIYNSAPWSWVHRIGVIDQRKAQQVTEIIAEADHQPAITVEPDWYYR